MTKRIVSRLRPARDAEAQGQAGALDVFRTASEVPEFEFGAEAGPIGAGAWRLTIETPDAGLVPDAFLVLAKSDESDDERLVRLALSRDRSALTADFIVPHGSSLKRFAPVVSQELWRAGAVRLESMPLAEWRARKLAGLSRRWLGSPRRLLASVAQISFTARRSGLSGVRTALRMALSQRSTGAETFAFESFCDTVDRRNRVILADWATPEVAVTLSIIVPIHKTPRPWLGQLLDGLDRQTDRGFELVLVFDGEQPDLEAFVRGGVGDRAEVAIEVLPANRGVSAACNAGIAKARGDYVAVIDHDDLPDRSFVAAFRKAIATSPADIYFADEAVTDAEMEVVRGVATRGRFDRRHYISHPYIVHPVVVRKAVAERAGLFDETLTVSQDVDFFLRCVAQAETVVQIPLLLYYWRTHGGSLGHQAADRVSHNTRAAIDRFLRATTPWTEIDVRDGPTFNTFEVRPPPAEGARAAIVIPTRNRHSLLAACLASIEKRRGANRAAADVFVVDHLSDEPETLAFLAEEKAAGRIDVLRDEGPWNYAAINNAAVAAVLSKGRYSHLVFMNNDVELVTDDWLDRLLAPFAYGDVGVVGCCLAYPEGAVQHGGVVVGLMGTAEHAHKFEPMLEGVPPRRRPGHLCGLTATRDCTAVTGALMVVLTERFEAVGGFDEALAVGFNDVDLCLRIGQDGYATTYVGSVVAIHRESMSRPDGGHPEDTRRFRERWATLIDNGDEHYGAMLDWSTPMATVCLKRQKPFALRRTELKPELPSVPRKAAVS